MKALPVRILPATLLLVALGLVIAALLSLGVSARSGTLGHAMLPVAPFQLEPGKGLYLLSFSGEIEEDCNPAVRVTLDGSPAMDYRLLDLTALHFPLQNRGGNWLDQTLIGCRSGDRLSLLVVMQPQRVQVEGFERPIASCCVPRQALSSTATDRDRASAQPLELNFTAVGNGQRLLRIPVIFQPSGN